MKGDTRELWATEKTTGGCREKVTVPSPGERPRQRPALTTPWSWASSLQDHERMNFWLFKSPSPQCFVMRAVDDDTVVVTGVTLMSPLKSWIPLKKTELSLTRVWITLQCVEGRVHCTHSCETWALLDACSSYIKLFIESCILCRLLLFSPLSRNMWHPHSPRRVVYPTLSADKWQAHSHSQVDTLLPLDWGSGLFSLCVFAFWKFFLQP